jgi:hypothetical protein
MFEFRLCHHTSHFTTFPATVPLLLFGRNLLQEGFKPQALANISAEANLDARSLLGCVKVQMLVNMADIDKNL